MRVEVLDGVERRRRWSRDDKMRIHRGDAGARRGGDGDRAAARHCDELVFTWRRRARLATVASAARLVPVEVAATAAESVRSD